MCNLKLTSSFQVTSIVQQRGASLIELMVGLVIGLLVVLAAFGSLVYTHVSSTTMVDAALLQQKADIAFRLINSQVLQAGAIELVSTDDPNTVVYSSEYAGFDPKVTALSDKIISVHGEKDTKSNADILRVSYQDNIGGGATGTARDCLGNRPSLTTRVDSEFSFDATNGELKCKGAKDDVGAKVIIDGVEDFQVQYGIKTAGLEQYRIYQATEVPDWENIKSITICLQMRGDKRSNPRPGWSKDTAIRVCGNKLDANDGYLRRVYRRTFTLRNAFSESNF